MAINETWNDGKKKWTHTLKPPSSTSLVLCVFYSGVLYKIQRFNIGYIHRYIYYTTDMSLPNVHCPLLQVIKYHSYQRYQYRLLGPAEKAEQPTNREQYLNAFVKNCWCCYDINTVWCVCMCVSVSVKCGNEGIYLCTLLIYNCITVKKTLKHSYQKDCMSHIMIPYDSYVCTL